MGLFQRLDRKIFSVCVCVFWVRLKLLLMVKLYLVLEFDQCEVPFHHHYSQVNSESDFVLPVKVLSIVKKLFSILQAIFIRIK